jgi:hypothetical protein
MKIFHFRLVRHELTPDLHRSWLEVRRRPLPGLEGRTLNSFRIFVTGDESGFMSEYQHSTKWSVARDKVLTGASQTNDGKSHVDSDFGS